MAFYVVYGGHARGIHEKDPKDFKDLELLMNEHSVPGQANVSRRFNSLEEAQASFDVPYHQFKSAFEPDFNFDPNTTYIFTDGSSKIHNKKVTSDTPASWAIAVYQGTNLHEAVYDESNAERGRTNQEMELSAIVAALTYIAEQESSAKFAIVTDSIYALWVNTETLTTSKDTEAMDTAKNDQLRETIIDLLHQVGDQVSFVWTKGEHLASKTNGNAFVHNLATASQEQL
jgi:ribonuclease HI